MPRCNNIDKTFVNDIQAKDTEGGLLTTDQVHVIPVGDKLSTDFALKALGE